MSMTKLCYKCEKKKSLEEFSKNSSKKDGLTSQCRECHKLLRRNHYLKNRKKIIHQVDQRRLERQKWIISLKDKPCIDCGKKYPHYVMDFDHIDKTSKEFQISAGGSLSKEKILIEISKCELVCSNCHRIRTFE